MHILSSNTLVALAEKAVLDRLPPESFSAYCVATESDLEAATLLKLATHFNPLQIRSVGIFKGTTGAAWRMILEAFCKMGTLVDDTAETRGFQGSRYDSLSDVGEIRVYQRADFQSGSRVLKKVF